jgi:CHASE3 domain sensor protein
MKQNIGKKLGVAFGVILVIMIVAGGFSLFQLNKSAAAFRDVSEHEMTAALAAFGIRANFDEMVWATKNIFLRGKDREVFAKEIETFNYKLYDNFKGEYAIFLKAWEQAQPIYKSKGRDAADAIMKGKGRMAGDYLVDLVRSLRADTMKKMEDAAARTRLAVITMLSAFIVAVVIAVISTIYIVKQLTAAIEGVSKTSRGKKG